MQVFFPAGTVKRLVKFRQKGQSIYTRLGGEENCDFREKNTGRKEESATLKLVSEDRRDNAGRREGGYTSK